MLARDALDVRYTYHAVGQGLFASGFVTDLRHRLHWVFDCGTVSSQPATRIKAGLDEIQARMGPDNTIQLVALSHFDRDHLNGLVQLLGRFRVQTLILPYAPLWRRLLYALSTTDPAFLNFCIDPAGHLAAPADHRIGEIIFVAAAGSDGADGDGEAPLSPDRDGDRFEDDSGGWKLVHDGQDMPDGGPDGDDPGLSTQTNARVVLLAPGKTLSIPAVWEFLPYNDANHAPAAPVAFATQVAPKIDALLAATAETDRVAALMALKTLYDTTFGAEPLERNIISLFLYSGPEGSDWCGGLQSWRTHVANNTSTQRKLAFSEDGRLSQMFTGDGFLDTADRLAAFRAYFTPAARFQKIAALQVMHHGSRLNWHPGVASAIKPTFSIYSSDPNRGRLGWLARLKGAHEPHPHAAVQVDFRPYGPEQADNGHAVDVAGIVFRIWWR